MYSRTLPQTLLLVFGLLATPAPAQITADGTVSTVVTPAGTTFNITGGTTAGTNLFHSFSDFSVPTGSEAFFNNATNIANIFSRVTGNSASTIDGIVRANGTANLFLLNPNGILFGSEAELNLGGSFFATTADRILFENNQFFSATDTTTAPLLTVSVPIGLQFGTSPQSITVLGNGHDLEFDLDTFSPIRDYRPVGLQVNSGKTLALIGGDLFFEGGNLTADRGRIELGSVAQAGTVPLIPTADGFTLDYGSINSFGNLSFTQASSVEASGEGSGNLHFQARNISVVDASAIISNVLGTEDGGNVLIRATESVEIIGTEIGDFPSAFFNDGEFDTTGNMGNISIETGKLKIANNAFISNSIAGSGNGGTLNIAADEIELFNETQAYTEYQTGIVADVLWGGTGQGGDIAIEAQNIAMRDGTLISTNTLDLGDAGNLMIRATTLEAIGMSFDGEFVTGISTDTFASGQGGNLVIETDYLSVRDGAQLAAGTFGEGDSGNFIVEAKNIELTGRSPIDLNLQTGLFVDTLDAGEGGNLEIDTERLRIADGASILAGAEWTGNAGNIKIRASEFIEVIGKHEAANDFSTLSSTTTDSGNGGQIFLKTPYLRVAEGRTISAATFSSGDSGSIAIQANTVEISDADLDLFGTLNGIVTFVDPFATGNGGQIAINADRLSLKNGGQIDASTFGEGTAGNINLNAREINLAGISDVLEDGTQIPSRISSSSNTAFAAGSVKIASDRLTIQDGAEISVSSQGIGDAGNLNITARHIFLDNGSHLRAEVNGGNQGNINLKVSDTLLLRRGSSIVANATGASIGGNLNINASFIIAVPTENSDISANSESSFGGRVTITTNGIFGTQFRPQLTPLSDITASSGLGAAFSGMVEINQLTTDPSNGMLDLSIALTDPSQKMASGCAAEQESNRFVVTGRGGLPANPNHYLTGNSTWLDMRDLSGTQDRGTSTVTQTQVSKPIVEANSWRISDRGTIELIATVPNRNAPTHALNCDGTTART